MFITIIGGSGFIGTRLSRRLEDHGVDFQIFDKAPSARWPKLVRSGDVREIESLRTAIPQNSVVINLAAEHRDDVRPKSLYQDVNVDGARNISKVASERNVSKIIFTSSVAVYGFAPVGTDESGLIAPFNEYGRTKYEAEVIFKNWQKENSTVRTLIILRPTVVFGEGNRGNVYNLLRQIASGFFIMIGDGKNRKSLAYVENVCAFIEHSLNLSPGIHIFNYVDKPDYSMKGLAAQIYSSLNRPFPKNNIHMPVTFGLAIGKCFDIISAISGRRLPISAIRVKKFCANSVYNTAIDKTNFEPPVSLKDAIDRTIKYEFIQRNENDQVFYTE